MDLALRDAEHAVGASKENESRDSGFLATCVLEALWTQSVQLRQHSILLREHSRRARETARLLRQLKD